MLVSSPSTRLKLFVNFLPKLLQIFSTDCIPTKVFSDCQPVNLNILLNKHQCKVVNNASNLLFVIC